MDLATLEALVQESTAPKGPESGWEFRLQALFPEQVKLQEPLKRYTSIQIGGPADALVFPETEEQLSGILNFARENRVPWLVLGMGSNVLVRDGGIRGIVLRLTKTLNQFQILEENDTTARVEVQAGVPLPKIVELGKKQGWSGVEPLYGIPGSAGGALYMNAGTRAGEIQAVVESVKVMFHDGTVEVLPKSKLKFEYRHVKLPARGIILSGVLAFPKADPVQVQERLAEIQQKRRDTQPLDQPSLGSVFKNPEKGFAAQMIEELGLKGVRVGGARISEKHSNFIVNERDATAKDVLALIGLVRDKVRDELDLRLELEAKVLGEDESV